MEVIHFCFYLVTLTFLVPDVALTATPNITFSIEEELKNNTIIGSIIDEMDMGTEQINDLRFNFQSPPDIVKSLFRIDTKTSKIYTKLVINREKEGLCPFMEVCSIEFNVLIGGEKTAFFQSILISIVILDINDNTPTFQKNEIIMNLSESKAVHSSFFLDTAQDLDGGVNNSIQSYQLTSIQPQSEFVLVEGKSPIDGSPTLNLEIDQALDYEKTTHYELLLLAKDGGSPRRTGTLTIKVNVLDENDNRPKFKDSSVNITVKEDIQPDSRIFSLTATDKDSGKNGEIVYKFRKSQPAEIYTLFTIGETNGELRVKGNLEYKPGKVYTIIVDASDKGDNPKVAQAVVRVTVKDSGNNPPEIDVAFLHGSGRTVSISEGAKLEQFVAWIQVKDTDTGPNGDVSCSTVSRYFGLSSSGTKAYKVIVQHTLDRESISQHNITVTCHDNADPPLAASVTFTVIVTDENDNRPRFSEHYYSINMDENNKIGQEVIKVTAVDKDEGLNGEVVYAIHPATDTRFSINSETGVVTANESFDRELTTYVTFTVIAWDKGSPDSLNSTATVVVDIVDVNDFKPDFGQMIFQFSVKENLPVGSFVQSVSAVDKDEGNNAAVTYRLHHNLDVKSIPFQVLSNGIIKTNMILDRENLSRYDFFIEAFDHGTPSLTGSAKVTIQVLDVNDNVPKFIFPSKENYTIAIPHTTPVDSVIASVQAYDEDDGENGKVMFFLKSGDVDNVFYLNHETGSLYIKKEFKITADKRYSLKLEVKDRGSPVAMTTERDLHIVVTYVNVSTVTPIPSEENKFVLIVVSVVCVTVVLSIGLLAVICVLRHWDKDKNNNASLSMDLADGCHTLPNLYDAAPSVNEQKSFSKNKPKAKVSFSLDGKSQNTFNRKQLLQKLHVASPSTQNSEDKVKENDMEKLVVRMPSVHKPYDKHEKQTIVPKTHREDSPSETSGETITSDSGHGGSEEDFQTQLDSPSQKTFAINPLFVQGKDTPGIYVIRQHSNGSNADIPITKTPSPLDKRGQYLDLHGPKNSQYLDDSLLTASVNSMSSYPSQNSHKNVVNTLPTIHSFSDLNSKANSSFDFSTNAPMFYTKDNIYGSHSAYSRDDDDVTTTSGSYTINPDELDVDEFISRPKDLYV